MDDLTEMSKGTLESCVLQIIGADVAAFRDDLIKDSPTSADRYQESIRRVRE
ncbi:hypothetical protein [Nonomuraea fuscirosea]|uniref:hypothetical protein n=1 Tax=Nonomuraea fuscirosea TaxID=1291556 RepID=UPI00342BA8CA